jgi:DNA-binding NarL/FixJ family response regulator
MPEDKPETIMQIHITAPTADPQIISAAVERALSKHLHTYVPDNSPALLTSSGRVLLSIIENPGTTLREIATQLNVTEANVQRTVSNLWEGNLVERRTAGRYHHYHPKDCLTTHPDIQRILGAVEKIA